jgi:hypothetical protein
VASGTACKTRLCSLGLLATGARAKEDSVGAGHNAQHASTTFAPMLTIAERNADLRAARVRHVGCYRGRRGRMKFRLLSLGLVVAIATCASLTACGPVMACAFWGACGGSTGSRPHHATLLATRSCQSGPKYGRQCYTLPNREPR